MSNTVKSYWEPSLDQVKLILRKKRITWKKATASFSVDEMVHWFRVGNGPTRVADAVLLRIKDENSAPTF